MLINSIEESINEKYTFGQMRSLFSGHYLPKIINGHEEIFRDLIPPNNDYEQKDFLFNGAGTMVLKKDIMAKILSMVFSKKELFLELMESLPSSVNKVFEMLTWNNHLKAEYLEKELGVSIISRNITNSFEVLNAFNPDYLFFAFSTRVAYLTQEQKYDYTLFLPDIVRKQFKEYVPSPEGYQLIPLNDIEVTKFRFENSGNILNELPLYISYVQQGHLKCGKNSQPLKTSFKKMKNVCEIEEFYENTNIDKEMIRTKFISNLLLSKRRIKDFAIETSNPLELFKLVFKQFEQGKISCLQNFLFHLKGVNQCIYQEDLGCTIANLLGLLRCLPVNKWVRAENLHKYVYFREIDLKLVSNYAAERYLYFQKKTAFESFYDKEREYITTDYYYREAIIIPLINASMFFFAGLGLLDIAYDAPENSKLKEKDKEYLTLFDGLRYIRLSDLGAYITEQKSDYKVESKNNNKTDVILDEERLIVTLSGNDKLKKLLLSSMADKIGENLFKLSYSSVFKDCNSKRDVEKKIETFKNEISNNLPQKWIDFFADLLSRHNPLEFCPSLFVYKIADNKELIRLIAKDEVLKKYILKAEDYHIVISKSNFPIVKKRLESFGYLMGRK